MRKNKLGKNIATMRRFRRLTQLKLSKLTGLSQSTIAQIESGRKNPSISALVLICKKLDVSVYHLLESDLQKTIDDNLKLFLNILNEES